MTIRLLVSLALMLLPFGLTAQPNSTLDPLAPNSQLKHSWRVLKYEAWNCAGTRIRFILGEGNSADGLWLHFDSPERMRGGDIQVHLLMRDGNVLEPLSANLTPRAYSPKPPWKIPPQPPRASALFPWTPETMDEAWIEVTIAKNRVLLAVPAGFYRDPNKAIPTLASPQHQEKTSNVRFLAGNHHVLRWESVEYDLGEIQNGWRLSLTRKNRAYGESELTLYQESSSFVWQTCAPQTSMRLLEANGRSLNCRCIGINLPEEDHRERHDVFKVYGNRSHELGWDEMQITVDDKQYGVAMPSSLF
jgi:hypothetical protein